jgi:hypothetical protein
MWTNIGGLRTSPSPQLPLQGNSLGFYAPKILQSEKWNGGETGPWKYQASMEVPKK